MTVSGRFGLFVVVSLGCFVHISGDAALIRPTARGMMWIKGTNSPNNYNYMGLNCGGLKVGYMQLYCRWLYIHMAAVSSRVDDY